jgi:hypothetical protein
MVAFGEIATGAGKSRRVRAGGWPGFAFRGGLCAAGPPGGSSAAIDAARKRM